MSFLKTLLSVLQWSARAQAAAESYHGDRTKWAEHVFKKAGKV